MDHLVLLGFHMVSLKIQWTYMVLLVFIWFHLYLYGKSWGSFVVAWFSCGFIENTMGLHDLLMIVNEFTWSPFMLALVL